MAAPTQFDDEAVRILLDGTAAEVEQGLAQIDQTLRGGLCGLIRREFPGLSPEDLAELWGSVLLNLWQMVQEGRFDVDRPLLPLLCQLARRRATDCVRRQEADDRLLAALANALQGTQTGNAWGGMAAEERREVMSQIRAAIATLPARQRIVMEVFVDHYPETADMQELRRLVSDGTGQQETLAAVKRALQEARAKVRERLRAGGYGVGKAGAS